MTNEELRNEIKRAMQDMLDINLTTFSDANGKKWLKMTITIDEELLCETEVIMS